MGIWERLESALFVRLLRKRSGRFWPLQEFYARCEETIMPGVDLAIIDKRGSVPRVLLARRAPGDPYFPGEPWHLTGGMIRPKWTALSTLQTRIPAETGMSLTREPELLDTRDILMGPPGLNTSPRGQEVYRLFMLVLQDGDPEIVESSGLKFFPLNEIPANFIEHQRPSIDKLRVRCGV
jgi:ADP-ribose pyrophosphatase YjhB (NUDIX family)